MPKKAEREKAERHPRYDYETYLRQQKKDEILSILGRVGSTIPTQIASYLGRSKTPEKNLEEVEKLLSELEDENLVENISGRYYHLTYEGFRRSKKLRGEAR